MDFVISKVAMAVTSLLVLAVLAEALDDSMFLDQNGEITRVLSGFCVLVERAHDAEAEIDLVWSVPIMPTGAELRVTVEGSRIIGESEGCSGVAQPMCEYHTWRPIAGLLNSSAVLELDRLAPAVVASSGQVLSISVVGLLVDSSETFMVFVLSDG